MKGLRESPQTAMEISTTLITEDPSHCRSAAFVECRLNPGFSNLVQKTLSMHEQDKTPAENENQDYRRKGSHYGPETDVVHQPAE